jgi:serine/threonine-protein kinase
MRLEREGAHGLAVVDEGGARSIVTGAAVFTCRDAPPDWSGDRARWSEASLRLEGDELVVRVIDVTDHEVGTDRRSVSVFRSSDRGRTWTRDDGKPDSDAPVVASLSTHWSALERVGDYRLIRRLGEGSLGVLYEALASNGDVIALRLLEGAGDVAVRARVDALGDRLARVRHPNVVTVRAIESIPTGPLLVANDLSSEGTLEEALARSRRGFAPERAVGIASDMLAGLDALHAAGVVHGDVRPANVFFVSSPHVPLPVALADAALLVALDDPRGTKGTARMEHAYLAPEALKKHVAPDVLADTYGVGACLYEMLSGQRPFTGPNTIAVAYEIVTKDPAPLTSTPPALAALVARAMAKDPAARYQTAAAMRDALQSLVLLGA